MEEMQKDCKEQSLPAGHGVDSTVCRSRFSGTWAWIPAPQFGFYTLVSTQRRKERKGYYRLNTNSYSSRPLRLGVFALNNAD
jgi:hypothetical protein